jgi:uncharacterized protein (TIRG00374 family)
MMNILLPARTGELSYVYLVKKIHSKTTGEGIATLIVARVFDFVVIIFLLFAAGLFIRNIPKIVMDFLWIISIFLFCIVILLIALVFFGNRFIKVMKQTFEYLYWDKSKYGNYILQKGDELVISFDTIGVRKNVFLVGFLSISIWVLSFVILYIILIGMGIFLPIPNVIMGSTFILLTSVLPIHGIGGFGTTEAIWTLVYIPLGMTTNEAIISGFGYHLIILFFASILGLSGFLFLKWGTPSDAP